MSPSKRDYASVCNCVTTIFLPLSLDTVQYKNRRRKKKEKKEIVIEQD
jgi:hypothetical protein